MRNFQTRKSKPDRMALLSNPSPAESPSRFSTKDNNGFDANDTTWESFDQMQRMHFAGERAPPTPQKDFATNGGAIQFVPAYEEALSPATTATQPPTPDDSFSAEGSSQRRLTPPSQVRQRRSAPNNKARGTRMGRLASLFSSRAVVKNMAEQDSAPSPPRSEGSSGYVGWPGTQDKRGGTVAIESDSDAAPSETPSYNDDDNNRSRSSQHNGRSFNGSDGNPADFHLAAAVADAAAAASSPMARGPRTEAEKVHRMATPMHVPVNSLQEIYGHDDKGGFGAVSPMTDPWGLNTSDDTMSDVSTSFSKTSSAYFNANDVSAIRSGKINHLRGVGHNRKAAAAVMRFKPGEPQPLSEEALAMKDHFSPPHRAYNAGNTRGYCGYLDKTKDVPNLMDGTESDTCSTQSSVSGVNASSYRRAARPRKLMAAFDEQIVEEAGSDIFDGINNKDVRSDSTVAESDVFDGLSTTGSKMNGARQKSSMDDIEEDFQYTDPYKQTSEGLNVVLLGGGLTTIQTTSDHFSTRKTASDFDENLTNSDCDDYGFTRIPGFNEMASAGKNIHDRSLNPNSAHLLSEPSLRAKQAIEKYRAGAGRRSFSGSESGSSLFSDPYPKEGWGRNIYGSLNQYYVHPDEMKTLVKFYRKMSRNRSPNLSYDELEREEDATKAFALSEMRSRIMEKDIERGLERQGGTNVVDDIVLTPYHRTALTVRDAVIVAKAWRDGATPMDVINTSLLTRRAERSHFILRPNKKFNGSTDYRNTPRYTWEEVLWVDDLEMSQYRCHSKGPRHLRGFEMFTIGDCQSILLKLCNERCMELRDELNEATSRQIEAEFYLKEEAEPADGMMTEAEMTYLSTMEEVKTISRKLVLAEKSFNLVRDRIERLVSKYESLLVKFENDTGSIAPSSVITCDSYYSEYSCTSVEEREREKGVLARRAQRAELKAELAAREAMIARLEARAVRAEKEDELRVLQERLNELQSESSANVNEREHSVVLARAITASRGPPTPTTSGERVTRSKIDDVKKRFRDRSAAKMKNGAGASNIPSQSNSRGYASSSDYAREERSNYYRAVGEEMFQHLDFYERSLKAVESSR